MEIQYFGANCVRIQTKKASIVIDDNLVELGQKSVTKPGDIVLFTSSRKEVAAADTKIAIDSPGEYEVSEISIHGIGARSHIDEAGTNTTMFKIVDGEIKVLVTGHVYPDLSDDQLEQIGMIDVLIVPVGGNGYTLDAVGALKLTRKIDPKLVVPTHFDEKGFNFEVPQQPLEETLKTFAMEPKETVDKLKVKLTELTDTTQLVILQK